MDRILNIAVATDTILYVPFYGAYYSGDFDDTPYGKVRIKIIARGEDDLRFSPDTVKNLGSADGFVVMCLVFGYADVGICDPSLIAQLKDFEDKELAVKIFNDFKSTFREGELSDFIRRDQKNDLSIYDGNGDVNKDNLWKVIQESNLYVIGGMISKLVLSAICPASNKGLVKNTKPIYLGSLCQANNRLSLFAVDYIDKILQPPSPSTGYWVSEIVKSEFKKKNESVDFDDVRYGDEFMRLLGNSYAEMFGLNDEQKKDLCLGEEQSDAVGFTCDYISLDYFKERKKIVELGDYVKDFNSIMYTGVIINDKSQDYVDKDAVNAFLYAINKNLYLINDSLSKGRNAVVSYLNTKLNSKYNTRLKDDKDIMKMLVSDPFVEEVMGIDEAIYYFGNRLYSWHENNYQLYYDDVMPEIDDFNKMISYRREGFHKNCSDRELGSQYVKSEWLKEWYDQEEKINSILNKKNIKGRIQNKLWYRLNEVVVSEYISVFIALQIISILLALFGYTLYDVTVYILKPGATNVDFFYYGIQSIVALVLVVIIMLTVHWAREVARLKDRYKYYFKR